MSKGCLKCGTQNADAATLCRGCGAALDPPPASPVRAGASPVCRVCGHVNRSATRFCSKCGADQTLVTDPHLATEPVDYSILATLPPPVSRSAPDLPHPAASLFGAEPAPRPLGLWVGLAALVIALGAGAVWWTKSSQRTAPPVAPAASVPQPTASAAVAASAPEPASAAAAASAPASAAAPEAASASASAPAVEPPAPAASAPEPAAAAATTTEHASAAAPTAAADKAARDARAKALRERRAQAASQAAAARAAEQEAARRRADEARAAAAAAAATPPPPPVVAAPVAPLPRTAQEVCAGGNLIVRTLCESRECSRREHADEPLCQRLRAAEEKRRQQD